MAEKGTAERIAELERELAAARAENAELKATASKPRRSWRQYAAGTLLVLGLISMIPANLLIWANRTVTNTDNYLAAVGPVIKQPAVQKAIVTQAHQAIFDQVDVDAIVRDALPERAQFLAGPIASQAENYTTTALSTIVASPQFATIWVSVNRQAQTTFMAIAAKDRSTPVINVNDLYKYVSQQIQDTPIGVLANRDLPPKVGNIELATVPALTRIPHFVSQLELWRWVFLLGSVVLLALAVVVSTNRRRMVIKVGIGWIFTTLVMLVTVRVGRNYMLSLIGDPVNREAAIAIWQTVLTRLYTQAAVLLTLGLVTAVTGWLLGPARLAVAIRLGSQTQLARGRQAVWPALPQTAAAQWLKAEAHWVRLGIAVLAVATLLLLVPLTVFEIAMVLLGLVIIVVVLEFIIAPPIEPDIVVSPAKA